MSIAVRSLLVFCADIKLAHSVFAIPFAASILFLLPVPLPSIQVALLLLACMITARSWAMGMNRFIDREIDGRNPRTAGRMIPAGRLPAGIGLTWTTVSGVLFILLASRLNATAGWLSIPLLLILASYSYAKRVSWLTHWYLGLCLGLAPIAVTVALNMGIPIAAITLGAAVAAWTGGFDVLYALQDMNFDRKAGLHSAPARLGPRVSIYLSRASFLLMIGLLIVTGWLTHQSMIYFVGVAIIFVFLAWEHYAVRDAVVDGQSRGINAAFFNANAAVSLLYLTFVVAAWWSHA